MTSSYGQRILDEPYNNLEVSPETIIHNLKKLYWKQGVYVKQSWGNWLHKMAPYAGRMKPAFAHWLILLSTKKDDVILDPFCGIGTIPLEANLLGRNSVGVDLNPYAYVVTRAKMDRHDIDYHLDWLDSQENLGYQNLSRMLPEWVFEYYNLKTLEEILDLRNRIIKEKRHFLLGCLIGVAQGHRVGHLSKPSALTLPFRPRPDAKDEYKEVIPRMIAKVKRVYRNSFPMEPCGRVYNESASNLSLETDSVDAIISSPPYFNTVDYVSSNRLRLALLGYFGDKKDEVKKNLIQTYTDYIDRMREVFLELKRVLKPKGVCILVLGDTHTKKIPINTAEVVKEKILDNIGFKTHGIIDDIIPVNKSVQRTPHSSITSMKSRLDRIMVITNES